MTPVKQRTPRTYADASRTPTRRPEARDDQKDGSASEQDEVGSCCSQCQIADYKLSDHGYLNRNDGEGESDYELLGAG